MTCSQSVQYGSNIPVLNTVQSLRTYNDYQDQMTVIILGNTSFSDGNGGIYTFDSTSSASDDGYNIIQPTSIAANTPGRYILSTQNLTTLKIVETLGYTPANGKDYLPLVGGDLTGNINGTTAGFSGTVYVPTQPTTQNDTSVATTEFVNNLIASNPTNLISGTYGKSDTDSKVLGIYYQTSTGNFVGVYNNGTTNVFKGILTPDIANEVYLALNGNVTNNTITVENGSTRNLTSKVNDLISVLDYGVVGDGATDDTANITTALAAGATFFPNGVYKTTNVDHLLTQYEAGTNAKWVYNGVEVPVGSITGYTWLPVPTLFPDIQTALQFVSSKTFANDSGYCSIQVAKGTYGSETAPAYKQVTCNIPDGGKRVEIMGGSTTPSDTVIYFDTTSNQSAFYISPGSSVAVIGNMTIIGVGAWTSHGVWANQGFGGGIWCEGGSVNLVQNFSVSKFYYGIRSNNGAYVACSGDNNVTVDEAGDVGFHSFGGSTLVCSNTKSTNASHVIPGLGFGYMAESDSFLHAEYSTTSGNNMSGFVSQTQSAVWAQFATSTSNGANGFYGNNGFIEGTSSSASNNGGNGYYATIGGMIGCNSAKSTSNNKGFVCWNNGVMDITVSTAESNKSDGYSSSANSTMSGDHSSSLKNGGNGYVTEYGGIINATNSTSTGNTGWGYKSSYNGILQINGYTSNTNTGGDLNPSTGGDTTTFVGNYNGMITTVTT